MSGNNKGFRVFSNIIMILLSFISIMPLVLFIISSITRESVINQFGYSFFPREIDFTAYRYLFKSISTILNAYGMTIIVAGTGTIANLFLTVTLGYMLSKRDLPGRNFLSFFVFFTMLFNCGMIPSYIIWSQVFHVTDTVWGLILPNLMLSAFNVILIRTYFSTNVPQEIVDAAEVDACSQIRMLGAIYMPLSKPIIATLSLFSVLAYWNDWINGLYYIVTKKELYTIQNVLNSLQNNADYLKQYVNSSGLGAYAKDIPSLSFRMALAVMSVAPILIIFPFFQKSFVRGIVIGGVKG